MPGNTDRHHTYEVGKMTFVVEAVYPASTGGGETISDVLFRLMMADLERPGQDSLIVDSNDKAGQKGYNNRVNTAHLTVGKEASVEAVK